MGVAMKYLCKKCKLIFSEELTRKSNLTGVGTCSLCGDLSGINDMVLIFEYSDEDYNTMVSSVDYNVIVSSVTGVSLRTWE
jgi:hypothetical protein